MLRLPGRRGNVPARQNTLSALLDWSFRLLSPAEQRVLRRLSVFRNGFTDAAATEVVAEGDLGAADVQEALLDLVAKSLVAPARDGDGVRRRLLDTTRVYAGAKLAEAGERDLVHRRHARWMAAALAEADGAWNVMTRPRWVARYAPLVDDVRASLDWAFAPGGDLGLGAELAASGFALGRQMLLVDEFTRRVEHAISVLSSHGEQSEQNPSFMRLRFMIACLGGGGMRLQDFVPALERAAAAPDGATEALHRFNATNALWALSLRKGDFGEGATWATRLVEQAGANADPVARLVANRIQAQTLHFNGRHAEAIRVRPGGDHRRMADHPAGLQPIADRVARLDAHRHGSDLVDPGISRSCRRDRPRGVGAGAPRFAAGGVSGARDGGDAGSIVERS